MKTRFIATAIAGLGAIMMCMPLSASEKGSSATDSGAKKENIFKKGKKAVVDAAHAVADKSVEIYDKAKDGTVENAEKVAEN